MKIQLIRNATMRIEYAGRTILTDPCLAEKGALPSYAGRGANPLVPLPMPADRVVAGIDLVLLSHLHKDHFDPAAAERIPIETPILCRAQDAEKLWEHKFSRVRVIENILESDGIEFHAAPARHGTSEAVLAMMGTPCGYILRAKQEPTLYWAGDSVWYEGVRDSIAGWRPDVIVTHSGGAVWNGDELIVMDAEQTVAVCRFAPESRVAAVHMEAFDHCTVSRKQLRRVAREAQIPDGRLLIPADGEEIAFTDK